jgi:hypothetical protein
MKVFISSTFRDLESYRRAVLARLRTLDGVVPVSMETFGARDASPKDFCLEQSRLCDIFVGLIGHIYGFVPQGDHTSLTEQEYLAASSAGKPRLLFVAPGDFPVPANLMPSAKDLRRQKAFRRKVQHDYVVDANWTSPDALASSVVAALSNWRMSSAPSPSRSAPRRRRKGKKQPLSIDLSIYADRARKKWETIDLSSLARPGAVDEEAKPRLKDLFIPQLARRTRPLVSLTRDYLLSQGIDPLREDTMGDELRRRWQHAERAPILHFLSRSDLRHTIVLGDPGGGKSSLMRFVLLRLLEPVQTTNPQHLAWRLALDGHIPFLIELRDYVAREREGKCNTLFAYLGYLGREQGFGFDEAAVIHLVKERGLLLIDGLDEVFDPSRRRAIADEIIGLTTRYPSARVIVSSRIAGFDAHPFEAAGFEPLTIDDLDGEQITIFANAWFTVVLGDHPQQAAECARDLLAALDARPQLKALAGNPLLLTIMAIVARHEALERSRVGLYEQALSTLSYILDFKHKGLSLSTDSPLRKLAPRDKIALLRHVAWAMHEQRGGLRANAISEAALHDALTRYFEDFNSAKDEVGRAVSEMLQVLQERNWILTLRGPALYGFVHRTFLEYLCAAHLLTRFRARTIELESIVDNYVVPNLSDDSWHEVIRLLAGQIGRDTPEHAAFMIRAIAGSAHVNNSLSPVALALECLAEQDSNQLGAFESVIKDLMPRILAISPEPFDSVARAMGALSTLKVPDTLKKQFELSDFGFAKTIEQSDAGRGRDEALWREIAQASLILAFWPTSNVGRLALERVATDYGSSARVVAARSLSQLFGDDRSAHAFLSAMCLNDPADSVRSSVLRMMPVGEHPDAFVEFLRRRAVDDPNDGARAAAVARLLDVAPTDESVEFLRERFAAESTAKAKQLLINDAVWSLRDSAMAAQLFRDIALSETVPQVRTAALQALSIHNSAPLVMDALQELATTDPDGMIRGSAALALVRLENDIPSAVLLSRDLDAAYPALDLAETISASMIKAAALKLTKTEEEVAAMYQTLGERFKILRPR